LNGGDRRRHDEGGNEMPYLLALIGDEPNFEELSPDEMQATIDEMDKYNKELEAAGAMVTGAGLAERATGTTIRFGPGGETTVTDGPFAETKEQLAGFWIIQAADLDEALEWAKKVPLEDGAIEVRPLIMDEDISGEELLAKVKSAQ
jgi:hypothetical protein